MRKILLLAGIGAIGYTASRVYSEGASRSIHMMVGKPLIILAPKLGYAIEEFTHDVPKASKRKVKRSLAGLKQIANANMTLLQPIRGIDEGY